MHEYHDATFVTATIDWNTRVANLNFKLCSETEQKVNLTINEVSHFECPRRFPWGKSASVNRLDMNPIDRNQLRIVIEMQSGDKIVVIGKDFSETKLN